jgi:methylthioribulose-1-phosphate dehydratase
MVPRNPFPVPSPLDKILLNELVLVARECYQRGWSWGTAGNFSLKGADGVLWQSQTGVCKGDLRADLFVPIDLTSEKSMQFSVHRASAEMPVHAGIYKLLPDVKCVVHTHPTAVVELSKKNTELSFKDAEMVKALGLHSHEQTLTIPVLPNPTPEEMLSYSAKVKTGVGQTAKVVVLSGHGVWAWGRSPREALGYIEALDVLCQQRL